MTDNSNEPFDHFDDLDDNEEARELAERQQRVPSASTTGSARSLSRRKLLAGAGTLAGATALGIAGANAPHGGGVSAAPTAEIRFVQEVATPPVVATPSASTIQLPNGTALVTSPRLPLHGIGVDQVQSLLQGSITSWRDVGSPINLPVSAFAIDGIVADGMKSPQMVKDYSGLLAELNKTSGGLAVVPIDQIDFRVNTLALGGVDPLATGEVVRMAVTGDIIPGRNVAIHARKYGDWTHPFLQVKDFLAGFDVTVSNFECVISDTIAPPEESDPNTFDFIASSDVIEGMKLCGIDAISLANNHTAWNSSGLGIAPFTDMLGILDNAGFPYFGGGRDLDQAQRGWETTIGNTSIVFIGIDGVTANVDYAGQIGTVGENIGSGFAGASASKAGTNPLAVQSVMAKISDLAGKYDIVIPYFHMGEEYVWITPQ
ncbi:MAG: CapA family protein, partial [Thermomicrobiales bacterium]